MKGTPPREGALLWPGAPPPAPRDLIDTDVAIETPEHIVFRHRVAGPARRLSAYAIDLALCYGAVVALGVIVAILFLGARGGSDALESTMKMGVGLLLVVLFAVQWVYFVVLEASRGTTPGKAAMGLRVVTTSGRPIGFTAAALRNVLRAADALPAFYAVGVASMALSPRFQRLGDLVAGTMVIIPDHARIAAPLFLWPPARAEEMATLPGEVKLDADERAAIELFLRRSAALGPARVRELARMVEGPMAARFGFRLSDPARTLALLYDRAANGGRGESPPSSRGHRP